MHWKLEHFHKSYGDKVAVDDLSFTLEKGQCLALLGPNGSGKSTTVRTLGTLQKPGKGHFFCNDWDTFKEPARMRQLLGYVSQECALDKTLTGLEMMKFQAGIQHVSWTSVEKNGLDLLKALELTDVKNKRIGSYSGGMKRRLDLAMALLNKPALLMLDEPSAGLDIEGREMVWKLIQNIKSECAIILASHDFQEIDALSDHLLILDKGHTTAQGNVNDLKAKLGKAIARVQSHEFMNTAHLNQLDQCFGEKWPNQRRVKGQHHVYVAFDSEAFNQIQTEVQSLLQQAQIPLFSFQAQKPSLEDVYRFSLGGQP